MRPRLISVAAALAAWALGACAALPESALARPVQGPRPSTCPEAVSAIATCFSAQDDNGAFLLIARPHVANGMLVVHAHGGPRLSPPAADDSDEDLERFATMVAEGYAWIGSSYRQEGYGVRRAAADVDRSRALYWEWYGRPSRTILHGQSWGGQIAAKVAELYGFDGAGAPLYDAVLLTNGVLAGGAEAYAFRADLRVVYQYYCRNHPRADEVAYPLWQGLPAGATLTRNALRERVNDCTGLDRPAARRTERQTQVLADILSVTGVREKALIRHLEWATFTFPSLIAVAGGNPFNNTARAYGGSSDDAALNAGVERFAADPDAVARLAHDSTPSGLLSVPTLSLHAIDDPVASITLQESFGRSVAASGRSDLFLAVRVASADHSRLPADVVAAGLAALARWAQTGQRPSLEGIRQACLERAGSASQCPV